MWKTKKHWTLKEIKVTFVFFLYARRHIMSGIISQKPGWAFPPAICCLRMAVSKNTDTDSDLQDFYTTNRSIWSCQLARWIFFYHITSSQSVSSSNIYGWITPTIQLAIAYLMVVFQCRWAGVLELWRLETEAGAIYIFTFWRRFWSISLLF